MTNCPNCNAPIASDALECRQCGILFSKWQQRETNVAEGNMARYTTSIANATSSEFNWTILIIVSMVVLSIFFFIEHNQ
jgi:uncharacterized membrane protein YvbJ